MTFDFSHLYKTETVTVVDDNDNALFDVVVKQLSHGEKAQTQAMLMQSVDVPISRNKAANQQKIASSLKQAMKNGVITERALYEEVAAIQSWTLTDASGDPVAVCVEAWKQLPSAITNQIVEVIERLNPDLDEDFLGDDGSAGATE